MDASSLTTARAIFVSALLAGDRNAPYISQQGALALAKQLNRTINICSTRNIQLCKNSIVHYILPSPVRTTALFKYLLVLSKSCSPKPSDYKVAEGAAGIDGEVEGLSLKDGQFTPPKSAAKRLHIVYILHDVASTVHGWHKARQSPAILRTLDLQRTLAKFQAQLISLVRLAACRGEFSGDEVSKPLLRIIDHWRDVQLFEGETMQSLTTLANACQERTWAQALEELAREDEKRAAEEKKARQEMHKWVLPMRHSVKDDPDAPWHELPAANGLYMKSVRGYPLRAGAFPKGGFELKYGGQEADTKLQKEVSWLHSEMLHCFENYTNPDEIQDVDPLGNKIWKDPERPTRNYWGFTHDGIQKAKENAAIFRERARGYDDVAPLMPEPGSQEEVDIAIARARALAGGRGGFDNRGGRGRGGRGNGGGWRGPPRGGGNNFRGERGNGPPGRYY